MKYEIVHKPSYALARVYLKGGESVYAEAGAMVSMSGSIEFETKARGGLLKSLGRSMFGGESFFANTFTASDDGEVTFAPPAPGDIVAIEMTGQTILVQSGSFLAASTSVQVDTKWGGAKTFLSREGLFMLRCSGSGVLFVSSYGAIEMVELDAGQIYRVDTGHMVAFDSTVTYEITGSGGLKQTLFGGEGFICKYSGPGRVYYQTRNLKAFVGAIRPYLPQK